MRAAIRSLLKAREFTFVAVAVVAIGIGANTAVFSIVDAVLLRPLPFKDERTLFALAASKPKRSNRLRSFSYPAFVEIASRSRTLAGVAALTPEHFNDTGIEPPEQLSGARVSASFFDVIGHGVTAGRTFVSADDRPGAAPVAIIGRDFWQRRFHRDPGVIGRTLTLNGAPFTIVGALGDDLPGDFDGVDVWSTHVDEISGFTRQQIDGGFGYLTAVARLPAQTDVERAHAELGAIARGYAGARPANTDADPDATFQLVSIRTWTVGDVRSPLVILMAAVGFVLLIACANVANLVLVRAKSRAYEAAVRRALGASRGDLLRWMCAESLMLALSGGAVGILLAFWTVDAAAAALRGLPRGADVGVDVRALAFSLLVSVAAGLIFGLVPTSALTRQPPTEALNAGGRGAVSSRRGAAPALVIVEVALSVVLMIGAGLLLQSFVRLTHVPLGFRSDGLLTLRVSLPSSKYSTPAAMRSFMTRVVERFDATPGVTRAAASIALPPTLTTMAPYITGDQPMVGIGERPAGQWTAITPGYFATMGIPLVAGRLIAESDDDRSPLVVVISNDLARRLWPNESAIGKRLLVGRFPGFAEVIGVVGDVRNNGLSHEPMVAMYTPYAQRPWPVMQFAVRATGGDPMSLTSALRAAVAAVDPELPVTHVETMGTALAESIATERLMTGLLIAFGVVALAMAAVGLYGVIAYTVTQRTREIGVRVALGATRGTVLRLVLSDGLRLAIAGIAIGAVAAVVLSRALRSTLAGLSNADPATYAAVIALFVAIGALACVLPARRALRIDPLIALRAE